MTMWKRSKYELVEKYEVMMNFDQDSEIYTNSQTCLITLLKTIEKSSIRPYYVMVANAHISFNPRRGDIKLAQVNLILQHIEEIKKYYTVAGAKFITFLCGDFNSSPSSGVFRLITQGKYDCKSMKINLISGQEDNKILFNNKLIEKIESYCNEILQKSCYLSPIIPNDVFLNIVD